MAKTLITAAVLSLSLSSFLMAQDGTPISVERKRVLSQYGDSESLQLALIVSEGVGIISRQNVKRNGASALRIHFVVASPAPGPWGLQILDKNDKKVWSYSAALNSASDFWSDQVPGDIAQIEVFSVEPVPTLNLTIDRIIVSKKPTEVRSLTVNKLKDIDKATPEVQQWGRSVARLVFVGDGNGQFLCTGFLVAADLFLTNNHCIDTDPEMRSGLAEFDYDKKGMTPVTLRFKEILQTNRDLDFTLLRLTTNSGRQPFILDGSSLSENRQLVMIQHPAGRPKQVSTDNCQVFGAQVAGVTTALTDFGHGCDTLGGSSGSPAVDLGTGRVLGLHHLGFFPNNQPVNRAVRIQQILDFLNQNLTDAAARQALGLQPQ
jgi:hypothetical protein